MRRRILFSVGMATFIGTAALTSARADVPQYLTEQGRLLDASNNPVSGSTTFIFSLYTQASAGTAVWTETQAITLDSGFFSAQLGETTAIPPATFAQAAGNGKTLYLGIKVNSDPELSPRQPLLSVPFAFVASNAVGDITPNTVSVNGKTVIDKTGAWVGPGMGGAAVMTSGSTPAANGGVQIPAGGDYLYPVTNFNVGSATKCSIVSTGYFCGTTPPTPIPLTNAQNASVFAAFRPTGGASAVAGYSCYLSPAVGFCTNCASTFVVGVTPNTAYDFGCNLLALAQVAGQTGYCQTSVVCN